MSISIVGTVYEKITMTRDQSRSNCCSYDCLYTQEKKKSQKFNETADVK